MCDVGNDAGNMLANAKRLTFSFPLAIFTGIETIAENG